MADGNGAPDQSEMSIESSLAGSGTDNEPTLLGSESQIINHAPNQGLWSKDFQGEAYPTQPIPYAKPNEKPLDHYSKVKPLQPSAELQPVGNHLTERPMTVTATSVENNEKLKNATRVGGVAAAVLAVGSFFGAVFGGGDQQNNLPQPESIQDTTGNKMATHNSEFIFNDNSDSRKIDTQTWLPQNKATMDTLINQPPKETSGPWDSVVARESTPTPAVKITIRQPEEFYGNAAREGAMISAQVKSAADRANLEAK